MEKSLKEHIQHFKSQREDLLNSCRALSQGREAVRELSMLTDVFLVSIFSQAERKWKHGHNGTLRSVSLVPIGGYGRGELALHSDIDLMILCRPESEAVVEFISEHIFYPLWDAGLEIGHGVRTIEECVSLAEDDFYAQTSFLDARCLAGNRELFRDLLAEFYQRLIEGRRKGFLERLLSENDRRYHKYGEAAFLLEPNVKEGRGGLRDYHSILWTAKALFSLHTLEDLETAAMLSARERSLLEDSLDFLWRVRNRLHSLSNRKNDQLFFDYQEDLARTFGFAVRDEFLEVEEFMKAFYSHVSTVEHLSSQFFERILHALKVKPEAGAAQLSDHVLEKGISIYKGELRVERPEVFRNKPCLLMRVFEYAAKHGVQLHPQTCQIVMDNLDLIDDAFRASHRVRKSLLNLLTLNQAAFALLETMAKTGVLTRYLPEFERIRCQVQHDAYHIHTVDRHSLLALQELSIMKTQGKYPFAEIEEPEYLFLAALLHDIGKGVGHNHAERGAELIVTIGNRMDLPERAVQDMAFVVRHHLLLSEVAMRRDLDDEKVITQCAQTIQELRMLNMLYLLTIADSRATGPRAWSDWKASLIDELFLKVKHILEKGELATADATARMGQVLDEVKNSLEAESLDPAFLDRVANMPGNYLLTVPAQRIVKHIQLAEELSEKKFTFLVEPKYSFWELTLLAKDSPGLFSRISGVLTLNDLDIMGAQVFTWRDGTAVELFQLRSLIEEELDEMKWESVRGDLERVLTGRLALEYRLAERSVALPLRTKRRRGPSKVVIDNEGSDFYTVIEVYTNDRPGLLYTLAKTLFDAGLDVRSAKISTKVDQIVDVFYVQDFYRQKAQDLEQCDELKKALLFKAEEPKTQERKGRETYIV